MKASSVIGKVCQLITLKPLRERGPKVAVLRLQGVIGSSGRIRGKGLNIDELRPLIEKAFHGRPDAVAVVINSPGGSPVQSSLIHDAIREQGEEKDIPIYTFAEDVCASGGYWLACVGDEIYAHPASIVGSIGVISAGFGFDRLIHHYGIDRRVYTQGENKNMLDPFAPEDPNDVAHLLSVQRDVQDSFIHHVIHARGKRLNGDSDSLFSGAFWSGSQAMDLGLVDGLGNVYAVMKEKLGDKTRFTHIRPHRSFLKNLFASHGKDDWATTLLSALETKALWQRFGL